MEFDGILSKLQGTLYSLGGQGLLNKANSVNIVVEALKIITEDLPEDAKSRVTFFMVLNTQLALSEELKDDEFVGLFTNITPNIEKEYLVIYLYHLNLQLQLFKVIENCPGVLSLELLDVIIKKLNDPKFHKDEFGIEHFYQLWQSVFVKICKVTVGLHVDNNLEKFRYYFTDIYNLIRKVLVISMKIKGLEKCVGLHLYYFFKTLLYFIELHKNPNVSDDAIYELSMQLKSKELNVTENNMMVYISSIFENIFKILENLTLDMWMTFSECYFDFDFKNSVQLLIGGLVYNIIKKIKNFHMDPSVSNCLLNFAINKSDLMAKADIDEIISHVKNGEKEWFGVLISHPTFSKKKSVECLLNNLNLASSENLNVILSSSYDYLCSCEQSENLDLIKTLFLSAVKKSSDYSHWLEKVFVKYQPGFLTTAHTHNDIIKTFNKISKENVPNCDIISLCMQSPFDTIKKISHIAVYDSHQTEFIIEILKLLKPACNALPFDGFTLLDYVLLKILEELTDKERQSFINLVVQLFIKKLLGVSFFNNSLKSLKKYLENEMLEKAVLCLEVIKASLNSASFCVDAPAFLVFMSQVLGHFSWDLKCFSVLKATGRDLAGQIIEFIIQRLEEAVDDDFHWARQEILKSWEVNQAFFCDLWFSCGYVWRGSGKLHSCILALAHSHWKTDDLRMFLINLGQPFEVRASVILSLVVLLPVLTFWEWNSIFNHLIMVSRNINSKKSDVDVYHDVLDIFSSSLLVLTLNLRENREIYPSYQYCLRNLGRLGKSYWPKMNEQFLIRILEKSFLILRSIENEEMRKSCWEILSPVLIELIDWMEKKNVFEINRSTIKELLPLLNLKDVAEVMMKKLR